MKKTAAVYAHIPFCVKKCPYCSFAVSVGQLNREAEYLEALEREAALYEVSASTVYIGGGTPSCLSPAGTERLMDVLRRNFLAGTGIEVTVEANPESVTAEKARLWKACGVSRVSLGVQSMDNGTLELLGRPHRREGVIAALGILRSAGFDNVNLDLMYGLPGQSSGDVLRDLDDVLSLGSEHLSLYALGIEPNSLFYARRMEVDADAQGVLYSAVCRRMSEAGVHQYEVSNFARPGFESRHNTNYWEGGDYAGLGMSAHTHMNGERRWNAATLPKYLDQMSRDGAAVEGREVLPSVEKLMEVFLVGLRMNRGVDLGSLERRFGVQMPEVKKELLDDFIEGGWLEEYNERVRATSKGFLLLDELSARMI
jgi:oxygen-independent coproporphyrinogen-3 oxidase